MNKKAQAWLGFVDELMMTGEAMANHVAKHSKAFSDSKLFGLLLLSRTMSHAKAIRILGEAGRLVEARILVRSCFENAFWISRLASDGESFLNEVKEDDQKRRNLRGQLLFDHQVVVRGETDNDEEFRRWMKENKSWAQSRSLDVKSLANKSSIRRAYVFYSELSVDCHPTTDTLSRYLELDRDGMPTIDFNPTWNDEEVEETFELTCVAAISTIDELGRLIGSAAKMDKIVNEFIRLASQ